MPPKLSAKARKDITRMNERHRKESEQCVEEGEQHLLKIREDKPISTNKPHYTKGLECFNRAIDCCETNPQAFLRKATCHKGLAEEKGQAEWEEAIRNFDKAAAILKDGTQVLPGTDVAVPIAPQLMSLLPDVYSQRAYCKEQLDRWDEAMQDYSSVIELQPEDDHAYNMRGYARSRKRIPGLKLKQVEFKFVIDDFSKAIELNENNYYAHANRGSAYFDNQEYRKAIEDYSWAMHVKDDYHYMLYRRAIAYFECVLAERAQAAAEKAKRGFFVDGAADDDRPQEEKWEEEFWQEERAARQKEQQEDFLQQALRDLDAYSKHAERERGEQDIPAIQQRVEIHLEVGTDEHLQLARDDLRLVRQYHEKNPKETKELREWEQAKTSTIRDREQASQTVEPARPNEP